MDNMCLMHITFSCMYTSSSYMAWNGGLCLSIVLFTFAKYPTISRISQETCQDQHICSNRQGVTLIGMSQK